MLYPEIIKKNVSDCFVKYNETVRQPREIIALLAFCLRQITNQIWEFETLHAGWHNKSNKRWIHTTQIYQCYKMRTGKTGRHVLQFLNSCDPRYWKLHVPLTIL